MTRKLDEIKDLLKDNNLESLWSREEVRPSMEWLIGRVEKLESYIQNQIQEYSNAGKRGEIKGDLFARPMSEALIKFAEEALAEEGG